MFLMAAIGKKCKEIKKKTLIILKSTSYKHMSKYLELVEVSEGVVVLRRSDQKEAPLVKIEFSAEVKTLLNGMEFDVAKEMIKSGIETLNSDIDVDALDDDVIDSFLKKDPEDRVVH